MLGLLLTIVVIALIAGLILWGIANLPWIDDGIKALLRVVIVVVCGIWIVLIIAGALGVNTGVGLHAPVLR